jgi:hypothetical protein
MEIFFKSLLFVFIVSLVGIAVTSFDRMEVVECAKWEKQSKEYNNFYLLEWQDQQCKAHGIIINADVKTQEI